MKTRNLMLAALALFVLALPSCAALKASEAQQEEIVTQIQKDQATTQVPPTPGTSVDANAWQHEPEYDGDSLEPLVGRAACSTPRFSAPPDRTPTKFASATANPTPLHGIATP